MKKLVCLFFVLILSVGILGCKKEKELPRLDRENAHSVHRYSYTDIWLYFMSDAEGKIAAKEYVSSVDSYNEFVDVLCKGSLPALIRNGDLMECDFAVFSEDGVLGLPTLGYSVMTLDDDRVGINFSMMNDYVSEKIEKYGLEKAISEKINPKTYSFYYDEPAKDQIRFQKYKTVSLNLIGNSSVEAVQYDCQYRGTTGYKQYKWTPVREYYFVWKDYLVTVRGDPRYITVNWFDKISFHYITEFDITE